MLIEIKLLYWGAVITCCVFALRFESENVSQHFWIYLQRTVHYFKTQNLFSEASFVLSCFYEQNLVFHSPTQFLTDVRRPWTPDESWESTDSCGWFTQNHACSQNEAAFTPQLKMTWMWFFCSYVSHTWLFFLTVWTAQVTFKPLLSDLMEFDWSE